MAEIPGYFRLWRLYKPLSCMVLAFVWREGKIIPRKHWPSVVPPWMLFLRFLAASLQSVQLFLGVRSEFVSRALLGLHSSLFARCSTAV